MLRLLRKDLSNELCLALADAVLPGKPPQLVAARHRLAQNGGAECLRPQQIVDLRGQTIPKLRATGGIAVVHADEDGVCQLVEVAVFQHGADQGVHGNLQITAGEVHISHDDPAVLVQRLDLQHTLLFIYPDLHTGVDIQRHNSVHGVVGTIAQQTEAAAHQQTQAGRKSGQTHCPSSVIVCFCHLYCTAFLFAAMRKNSIQNIRSRMGIRLPDLFVEFTLCHSRILLLQVLFQPFDGPVVF